jgi:hypothetical protein
MAIFVSRDCKAYAGGYDLSSYFKSLVLRQDIKPIAYNTFGDAAVKRAASAQDWTLSADGYYDAGVGLVDTVLSDQRGVITVVTACPTTGAAGQPSEFGRALLGDYSPLDGSIAEILPTKPTWNGTSLSVPGTVLVNGAKVADGNGTAYNIGACPATSYLYAALHVLAISGAVPTVTVTIASDALETFLSPTVIGTFAAQTTIGGTWLTPVAGSASGDTWWRATWDLGAQCTGATIVVSMGILAATF